MKQLEFSPGSIHPYYAAVLYASVKQDDQALERLQKAYEQCDEVIFYANVDPEWDHLRTDPKFVAILDKVGLNRG